MQSPVLHFFPFYKFLPPSDKRQQVEILQSLVLLVPEPPAFPGCLAVVLIQEPFHTVTIEEILVNVGRKNEILEMCTLQRILEEKRHRCKSTLFPLGGDGCRKQRFVMILQKIFRLKRPRAISGTLSPLHFKPTGNSCRKLYRSKSIKGKARLLPNICAIREAL